ncbi:MAG: hypothetical protein P3W96_014110 [Halomonas sp.]|nr:hypothetical protein [Halomonas sp.]
MNAYVEALRGFEESNVIDGIYSGGFGKYDVNQNDIDSNTLVGADIAFAVFTTAEFGAEGADWLSQLGLANDEIVYLLAGNSDTSEDPDDALLLRVSFSGEDINTQALANFENLDLNGFLEENWNTNYNIT